MLRSLNVNFRIDIFSVDGIKGALESGEAMAIAWKPPKPEFAARLLPAFARGARGKDGEFVLICAGGRTKWSCKEAVSFFCWRCALCGASERTGEHASARCVSSSLSPPPAQTDPSIATELGDAGSDPVRARLLLAQCTNELLEAVRLRAIRQARQEGATVDIIAHGSTNSIGSRSRGQGAGIVADAAGREFVERELDKLRGELPRPQQEPQQEPQQPQQEPKSPCAVFAPAKPSSPSSSSDDSFF